MWQRRAARRPQTDRAVPEAEAAATSAAEALATAVQRLRNAVPVSGLAAVWESQFLLVRELCALVYYAGKGFL